MRRIIFLIISICTLVGTATAQWSIRPPLPMEVSNNAVASVRIGDTDYVYSFMGIDTSKIWSGITQRAFEYNTQTNQWQEIAAVPGMEGRIAAAAVGFKGKVYLFGGYSVAPNGSETTYANVDIYDPVSNNWSSGAAVPVPVDDQVIAVWRDSLIYSVSGWSTNQNVKNVQIYNPETDTWQQATQIPGAGVFGHAGGIVGDTLVYFDGARDSFNFPLNGGNFMGVIDPQQPDSITWSTLPPHPGPRKYRTASATLGSRIFFVGGTDNPYNFNGIGYNGQPSQPSDLVFAFNSETVGWETYGPALSATMDHRAMAASRGIEMFLVGGMLSGQQVTNQVTSYIPDIPITGINERSANRSLTDFELIGNYPNPFNPSTRIRYVLQKRQRVQLQVFSIAGKRIAVLIDEDQSPGDQEVTFDAADFSSGVYLYRLTTDTGSYTRKMILMK